jgi:WD40 repeat protein
LDFTPSLIKLVPGDPSKAIVSGADRTEAWDLTNKCKMFDVGAAATAIAFQPLDSEMVALAQGTRWSLFDLGEGAEMCGVETGEQIRDLKFHPDGLIMATGHSNGEVKLWDIRS